MDPTESSTSQSRRTRAATNKAKIHVSLPLAIESEESLNDFSSATDQLELINLTIKNGSALDIDTLLHPRSATQTASTGNLLDPMDPSRSVTPDPTPTGKKLLNKRGKGKGSKGSESFQVPTNIP